MSNFRGKNGFPIRWVSEIGKFHENEFLYGVYEKVFVGVTTIMLDSYYRAAAKLGFPNHIEDSVAEKEISHDQLTAYSCYSFIMGYDGHKKIYKSIKWFKIDGRFLHPRDLIYYALLNYNPIAFLLLPLLYLFCAMSLLIGYRVVDGKIVPKLSGELLWVLRVEAVKKSLLLRIAMLPCELFILLGSKMRFGGTNEMISRYFVDRKGHPIVDKLK